MKLAEVLAVHDRQKDATGIPQSLGDGFLYSQNPVFRNVRDAATQLGFKFSLEDPFGYKEYPLLALDNLLQSKQIPYSDNVSALRRLEASHPLEFHVEDLPEWKQNYLLHESCHGIANALIRASTFDCLRIGRGALEIPRRATLRALVAESWASATETLGAIAASGGIHHFLYARNSYQIARKKSHARTLYSLVTWLGTAGAHRYTTLCYVLSNFLYVRIQDSQVRRCLELAVPGVRAGREELLWLREIAARAACLSRDFRLQTNGFFLRASLGIAVDLEVLLQFDPLCAFERSPALREELHRFSRLIELGLFPADVTAGVVDLSEAA